MSASVSVVSNSLPSHCCPVFSGLFAFIFYFVNFGVGRHVAPSSYYPSQTARYPFLAFRTVHVYLTPIHHAIAATIYLHCLDHLQFLISCAYTTYTIIFQSYYPLLSIN